MQSRRPSRAVGRCRKPRCRISGAETTIDVRTVQSRQRGKARIEVAKLTTRLSLPKDMRSQRQERQWRLRTKPCCTWDTRRFGQPAHLFRQLWAADTPLAEVGN